MTHDLTWVQRVDAGYEAECSCGKRFVHGARDSVVTLHEQHVHLEDLRAQLGKENGGA